MLVFARESDSCGPRQKLSKLIAQSSKLSLTFAIPIKEMANNQLMFACTVETGNF